MAMRSKPPTGEDIGLWSKINIWTLQTHKRLGFEIELVFQDVFLFVVVQVFLKQAQPNLFSF